MHSPAHQEADHVHPRDDAGRGAGIVEGLEEIIGAVRQPIQVCYIHLSLS